MNWCFDKIIVGWSIWKWDGMWGLVGLIGIKTFDLLKIESQLIIHMASQHQSRQSKNAIQLTWGYHPPTKNIRKSIDLFLQFFMIFYVGVPIFFTVLLITCLLFKTILSIVIHIIYNKLAILYILATPQKSSPLSP